MVLGRYRDLVQAVPRPSGRWADPAYRIATAFIDERLEAIAFDEPLCDLNRIASPVHDVRQVFDLMGTESAADWEAIVERLATMDRVLGTYRRALEAGLSKGLTASRRQVAAVVDDCRVRSAEGSCFRVLSKVLQTTGLATPRLEERLGLAVDHACRALQGFADFLEREGRPFEPAPPAPRVVPGLRGRVGPVRGNADGRARLSREAGVRAGKAVGLHAASMPG